MEVLLLLLFVGLLILFGMVFSMRERSKVHADQLRRLTEQIRCLDLDLQRWKDRGPMASSPASEAVIRPVPEAARMRTVVPLIPVPPMGTGVVLSTEVPSQGRIEPGSPVTPISRSAPPPLPPLPPQLAVPSAAPRTGEAPASRDATSPSESWDWEQFLGARLLSWVGGLVLFLAVAFFVKLSFERGWISPVMRVLSGAIFGTGLILGGIGLRGGRSRTTGLTMVGTGLLVLYGVTFACHSLYHFAAFSLPVTFGCMAAVTVLALVMSCWLDALSVAVLGIAAGFLTPVLLSSGVNNPVGLFGYVAVLDLGLMTVLWRRRWNVLALLGAVGTAAMQYGWFIKFASPQEYGTILWVFVGFGVAFTAALEVARRGGRSSRELELSVAGVILGMFGIGFSLLTQRAMMDETGAFFFLVGSADLLALAVSWIAVGSRRLEAVASGLVFLILAVWSAVWMTAETTHWGLWMIVGFGLLHAGFGFLKVSKDGPREVGLEAQLFPALCLLVLFVPLVRELAMPWGFWLAVLVLDLVAIAAAILAGSILAVAMVMVLSLGVAGVWLTSDAGNLGNLAESLLVIGGYAVLFFGAGCLLVQFKGRAVGHVPDGMRARIPAMAALLPFLLLNMVNLKMLPPDPTPIFGVAFFLALLSFGWAWWRGEGRVALMTLACVFVTQALWLWRVGQPSDWRWVLAWNLMFYGLHMGFPFVKKGGLETSRSAWVSGALAGPLQFLLIHGLIRKVWPQAGWMGLVPLAFAVPTAGVAWRLWQTLPSNTPVRLQATSWFGAVALFFVTVALPIQFDRQVLTVALALEGVAVVGLYRWLPHPGLRTAGVWMLVAAFLRLTVNPAVLMYPRSGVVVWNWYLYTYGIVTACLFVAARETGKSETRWWGISARPLLTTLGTVLAFVLVNLEIADAFASGPRLTIELTGNFARGLSYTVAWALFAFGLLVVGLQRSIAPCRYAGLVLMGLTLLKLLLVDTARLEQLYRIGAFAAVAVLSILASFLYQRLLRAPEAVRVEKNTTE